VGREMILEIILGVLLAASLVGNILLAWYSRKILNSINLAGQISVEFFARLSGYTQHLESVYQMEVFHADRTIRSLIRHTKELANYLTAHTEVTSFTQPDLLEQLAKIQLKEELEQEQDGYTKED